MKKIKIPVDTFVNLRAKAKFLEYYWSQYTVQNQDYATYEHALVVEEFIRTRFFEKVDGFKVNPFSKTVTLTEKTFEHLKKYAFVSDDLLRLINSLDFHKNTHQK